MVVIELVSGICNSRCKWCFMSYETSHQILKGMISLDNFKKFIDMNSSNPMPLVPYSHGEALIHPRFNDMMEYALENNYRLYTIHSNFAMNLTDRHFKNLVRIENITINIGGITCDIHSENTGTDLTKVVSNIERLINVKNKTGSNTNIAVKMLINRNNVKQKKSFPDFVKSIDQSLLSFTRPLYFTTSDSTDEEKMKFYEDNIGYDNVIECRDIVGISNGKVVVESKKKNNICTNLFLTIRWNGNVQLCCRPRKQDGIIGNAFESSINDIMHSEKFKEGYVDVLNREYVSYCKVCS